MDEAHYKARIILRRTQRIIHEALPSALTGRNAWWNFRPGSGTLRL